MFHKYPLRLDPFFSPRPWGGDRLRAQLGKATPPGERIGESWELSDHPDGPSRIANGPYAGKLFGELFREEPAGMCGIDAAPERFPLLVKYIDAGEDLSIQVHPDDANARPRGDRGKTECWYIIDCPEGAELICGLNKGVGPEELLGAAEAGDIERLLRRRPIRPGSFVYVPAGTVHAILAGTLFCEIQQSSNLTYRLWDWGRKPARPLHIEDAVAVANYGQVEDASPESPRVIETEGKTGEIDLVRNAYFDVRLLCRPPGEDRVPWEFENPHGVIVNVLEGGGRWQVEGSDAALDESAIRAGETWFIPAGIGSACLSTGPNGLRLLLSRSMELG